MRHLLNDADILEACYWRVSGVSDEQVQAEMETVKQWLGDLLSLDQINEDDPETLIIMARLKRKNDKRKTWGLLVALIALEGYRNGDMGLFYRSGCVIIQIHAQATRRASREPGGDSLSLLVHACVTEHPGSSANEIADILMGLAGNYVYPVLVDSDPDNGTLTCQLGDSLRDVKRQALGRRIQRARAV